MSGVYVYCVLPAGVAPAAGQRGVDGEPVDVLEEASLSAWYTRHRERPAAELPRIREHNAVAAAALAAGITPVPFRFGQWLGSDEELRDRIRRQAPHWRAMLDDFAGACEAGVRATWRGARAAREMQQPQQSGRAYLEHVAREHARSSAWRAEAEAVARTVREAVAGVTLRERVDFGANSTLTIAHLVRYAHFDAYCAAVAAVRSARDGPDLCVSGPWPPYSFVS